MKIKSVSMLAIAPIFTLALITGCANPCAAKTKPSPDSTEVKDPCAGKIDPCAGKSPCAGKIDPCAGK
ncbi:MAG: hypothetical protein QNJ38_03450 [Prochloraceae cyanobacterium]|nr:hypothetical protein [Prochloraceae cyanobacterium]